MIIRVSKSTVPIKIRWQYCNYYADVAVLLRISMIVNCLFSNEFLACTVRYKIIFNEKRGTVFWDRWSWYYSTHFSMKSNLFYNIIFCLYELFFIYRYVRLLARYPVVVLLGISVFSISALVCSLMLHDWPDFTDPQAVRA